MDASVIKAMARWPDVPAVYGWLSLDRRGRWCLRGEAVTHRGAVQFINRNYDHTSDGRWYFQNGPQRVFVDLENPVGMVAGESIEVRIRFGRVE